jgi:hypothetical protein
LDVNILLACVMTIKFVLKTRATISRDVFSQMSFAMTPIFAPLICATPQREAARSQTLLVTMEVFVRPTRVIQTQDVCLHQMLLAPTTTSAQLVRKKHEKKVCEFWFNLICVKDSCDRVLGCVFRPNAPCDDGKVCLYFCVYL